MLRIVVTIVVSLCWPSFLIADVFVREYTYQASDADSKITARQQALGQLKTLVLQEVGTSLHHVFTSQHNVNGQIDAQETLELITAGISKVNVLDEYWTGTQFYIKARIEVDTHQVMDTLKQRQEKDNRMHQQSVLLSQQQLELKRLQDDMTHLQQQIQLSRKPESQVRLENINGNAQHHSVSIHPGANTHTTPDTAFHVEVNNKDAGTALPIEALRLVTHVPLASHQKANVASEVGNVERLIVVNSTPVDVAVKFWQAGVLARKKMHFVAAGGQVIIDQRMEARKMTTTWYVQLGAHNSPLKTLGSVVIWSGADQAWTLDVSRLNW